MPIKRCMLPNGEMGYQWGNHGKCYPSRAGAEAQARAAYASGYRENKKSAELQLTAPELIQKYSPDQPRGEKGTSEGGQFIKLPGQKDFWPELIPKDEFPRKDLDAVALETYSQDLTELTQDQWDSLYEEEQLAVNRYTGSSHQRINRFLGTGDKDFLATYGENDDTSRDLEDIVDITDALNKGSLPENVMLFRATKMRGRLRPNDSDLEQFVGHVFKDPAFGSTSLSLDTAGSFQSSKEIILAIEGKAGTKGLYVDSSERSSNSGEREFILQRGTTYLITGVDSVRNRFGDKIPVLKASIVSQEPEKLDLTITKYKGTLRA